LVTARIHNLSGPHINKTGSYALATFILDAIAGGPIRVRAPHDVWRGYVAIRELMSLVFAILLEGKRQPMCFDTGGEPIELGELALAIAHQCGKLNVERPNRSAGCDRYVGDNENYASLLRQYRIAPVALEQQIAETIEFIAKTTTFENSPDWPKQDGRASRGCS
jgi:nucleoside-diphosphate-sugar epimerase